MPGRCVLEACSLWLTLKRRGIIRFIKTRYGLQNGHDVGRRTCLGARQLCDGGMQLLADAEAAVHILRRRHQQIVILQSGCQVYCKGLKLDSAFDFGIYQMTYCPDIRCHSASNLNAAASKLERFLLVRQQRPPAFSAPTLVDRKPSVGGLAGFRRGSDTIR